MHSITPALAYLDDLLFQPLGPYVSCVERLHDALIPVKTMICPFFLPRKIGSTALMMLTGPKKLVSNCSRTIVSVR